MQPYGVSQQFEVGRTESGWVVRHQDGNAPVEALGSFETEQAARAEAARLDILYDC